MGGEGVTWVGQAPFTDTEHVFQNLGDGTYFHSGSLAIRQAIAAGVNITYKILYNDAVAMTGGQPVDGTISVPRSRTRCAPRAWSASSWSPTTRQVVAGRDLPEPAPSSTTATNWTRAARAARGQGRVHADLRPDLRHREAPPPQARQVPRPAKRVFINDAGLRRLRRLRREVELRVGAAEGDRVRAQARDRPVQLQQGLLLREGLLPELRHRARRQPRKARRPARPTALAQLCDLPRCRRCNRLEQPWNILITGVGGTGVVTIGALLGMAAHLEGKGAPCSTDRPGAEGRRGDQPRAHRAHAGGHPRRAHRRRRGRPGAGLRHGRGTRRCPARSPRDPDMQFPAADIVAGGARARRPRADAGRRHALATALLGDAIATNLFMLGYAWQQGLVPISYEAMMRAVELNGAAIEMNKTAFAWGRLAVVDPQAVQPGRRPDPSAPTESERTPRPAGAAAGRMGKHRVGRDRRAAQSGQRERTPRPARRTKAARRRRRVLPLDDLRLSRSLDELIARRKSDFPHRIPGRRLRRALHRRWSKVRNAENSRRPAPPR
jgi:indolepyruvate ferredoxin oxidoreductase